MLAREGIVLVYSVRVNWDQVVERTRPSIVKIETPNGHGTGFLCFYNATGNLCGIATALHVVRHAERWQQPIRIHHDPSSEITFLKESDRVIFTNSERDSAVILMDVGKLQFPEQPIPLLPTDNRLPIGVEVGWLGYPAIGPYTLCFFSGNVSAWQDFRHAYLIDGIAINWVSGGPVVYSTPADGVRIVGAISAYMANRATGEALPGLSVAQDVAHFNDIANHIRSMDEARQKRVSDKQEEAQPAIDARPIPESDQK